MLNTKDLNSYRYPKVSGDTMLKQINLKMPENFFKEAKKYADSFGYRNIQELALESMREKVFEKETEYDETFTEREIELIERITELSLKKGDFISEEELWKKIKK